MLHAAEMSDAQVRIGVGGWTYPLWRRTFYPADLPHRRELEFASRHLGVIEINATFYGRQSSKSWATWAETVPDDFIFAVKGSRYVVTRPRLADAGEGVAIYLDQGLTALGTKLGPILWMLAARRQFDPDDIAAFFALLPREKDGCRLRHAIEARHDSFRDERFLDLARKHEVAIVYGDDEESPCIDADTADFRYARLQRMNEEVATGYDAASIDRFAKLASNWSNAGRDSFMLFINGSKVRAPAAALALQQRLGIARA